MPHARMHARTHARTAWIESPRNRLVRPRSPLYLCCGLSSGSLCSRSAHPGTAWIDGCSRTLPPLPSPSRSPTRSPTTSAPTPTPSPSSSSGAALPTSKPPTSAITGAPSYRPSPAPTSAEPSAEDPDSSTAPSTTAPSTRKPTGAPTGLPMIELIPAPSKTRAPAGPVPLRMSLCLSFPFLSLWMSCTPSV